MNVNPSKRAKIVPQANLHCKNDYENQVIEIKNAVIKLVEETYKNLNRAPLEDIRHAWKVILQLRHRIFEIFDQSVILAPDTRLMLKSNLSEIKKCNSYFFECISLYIDLFENEKTIGERLGGRNFVVLKERLGVFCPSITLELKIRNQSQRFLIFYDDKPKQLRRKIEEALSTHWLSFKSQLVTTAGKHPFPSECELHGVLYSPIFTNEKLHKLISEANFKELDNYFRHSYGYNWFLQEMLFSVNSPYKKEEIDEMFLKCVDYPEELGRILLHNCSLERQEIAEAAINFALNTEQACDLEVILRKWPKLLPKEFTQKAALHFLKFGYLWHAQGVIIRGKLHPNMLIGKFSPIYGSRKENTLENFWKGISTPFFYQSETTSHLSPDKFLKFLLAEGLNLKADSKFEFEEKEYSSFLEAVLKLASVRKEPEFAQMVNLLLENGPRPASAVINHLIENDKKASYRSYLNILVKRGLVSEKEIATLKKPVYESKMTLSEELELVIQYTSYLKEHIHESGLYQERLDLPLFSRIRLMKKKIKSYVNKDRRKISSQKILPIYRTLCVAYDQVVTDHVELNYLKMIGREFREQASRIKEKREFSDKLLVFVGLLTSTPRKVNVVKKINQLMDENVKEIWNQLYAKVANLSERVKGDFYLSNHFITWCHGTSSKNEPCIRQTGEILSLGDIIKRRAITFGGEHCGSEEEASDCDGFNSISISGEKLMKGWNPGCELYYGIISRFLLCYYYATEFQTGIGKEFPFDPFLASDRLTIENIKKSLDTKIPNWHGLFVRFRFDILRLRITAPSPALDQRLREIRQFLLLALQERNDKREIKEIKFILEGIDTDISSKFTHDELATILDPKPYGIIFASTTEAPRPIAGNYEFLLESPLKLGKEIQIIFTQADKVDELKQKFSMNKIKHVYEFDVAFYLEWRNIIRGEVKKNYYFKDKPPESLQHIIAHELQNEILPLYTRLFPKIPTYKPKVTKPKEPLPNPYFAQNCSSHEEYVTKVKSEKVVARDIHGPMHACRTAIGVIIIYKMFELNNWNLDGIEPLIENLIPLSLLGGAHDIMREDEQEDHWTYLSAKWARSLLLNAYPTFSNTNLALKAIGNKDPANNDFESIEQVAVHDADVLEIFRCLNDPSEFRREELFIFKKLPQNYFEQFIKEYQEFVLLTENQELKLFMERHVDNHYEELMRILSYYSPLRMPLIGHILEKELSAFNDRPVMSKILDILEDLSE